MIGCLFIHGFTGAPYEIKPLADYIQKKKEWLVRTPTLPGHGETLQLKGISNYQWVEHAENELKELFKTCETVYLIGFSMGGIIAGYLATKYPVAKLVMLSAAAYYVNPKQLYLDIKDIIKDGFHGSLRENELYLRYKKKITDTPISATIQFRKLVHSVRPVLKNIQIPTLIVQGECDGIVPVKSAHYLYQVISANDKKLCFLPTSKHLVCYGEDRDKLFQEIDDFLY